MKSSFLYNTNYVVSLREFHKTETKKDGLIDTINQNTHWKVKTGKRKGKGDRFPDR